MNGGENVKKTSALTSSGETSPSSVSASSDELAAKPNPSSIMSAPRDQKKNTSLIIILALSAFLIISIVLNVVIFGLSAARGTEIKRLEREVEDNQAVITDLKERLREQ